MNLTFDFAFEGFRIIRERPKLIAFWGAITLFGYGVMSLIMVHMAGPAVAQAFAMFQSGKLDPVTLNSLNQQIAPAILLCAPVYILMSSVLVCAVCRVVFGETDDRLGFLAFGWQEIRIMAVRAVSLIILFGVLAGISALAGLLGLLISGGNVQAAAGIQTLGYITAIGVALWLGIRLSLNGVQSFDLKRFDLFGSFTMTRDRFWSLFTGYATAFALAQVVAFLCDKIIEAIQVLALGLNVTGEIRMPDMTSVDSFLTPASVIATVLTFAFVMPLGISIELAASAAAYRTLRGKIKPREVEEKAAS
ncbi:hypothetical protein [Asticcacaulis sp.]|uniref:hypothetical protein n=1 Tax=Asticcacaulis sp. TaxID=1872648 RepID=UPI003F7B90A1